MYDALSTICPNPIARSTTVALIEIDDLFNKIETLPGLPDIIFHINEIDGNTADAPSLLEELSGGNPDINHTLLKVINSIYYSYPDPIASVSEAVALLGFELIRNLLLSVAFISTFPPGSGTALNHNLFWLHTATTAYICKNMAEARDDFSEEDTRDIFLSALLHDLGVLILESCYPEAYREVMAAANADSRPYIEVESDILQGMNHAKIGRLVATHWNCPEFLVNTITYHHDPDACEDGKWQKFVALFHVSHFIAEVTRIGNFKMTPTQPVSRKAIQLLGLDNDALKAEAMLILKREPEIKELLDTLLADYAQEAQPKKRRKRP